MCVCFVCVIVFSQGFTECFDYDELGAKGSHSWVCNGTFKPHVQEEVLFITQTWVEQPVQSS